MVLRNGQWEVPFWGAKKTFIAGQDMLGMQGSSIATYGVLVPGLTNLTKRVRYYGFYLWILEQYAKRVGKDSVTEVQKHIRRAELLLAYMMTDQFPDIVGVVGSLFARRHLDDFPTTIDLAKGADREEGKQTYWKYSFGAFGQYYLGSLVGMKLLCASEINPKIYVATPDLGRRLCACFEDSISEKVREMFWMAVDRGSISREDMVILSREFSLAGVPPDSSERAFYRTLFLGTDSPEVDSGDGYAFFRKDTILLYLSYLQKTERFDGETSFWDTFYTAAWEGHALRESNAFNGWAYYSLNENTHYSLETFLWQLLLRLEDGSMYLPDALEILPKETIEALVPLVSLEMAADLTFLDLTKAICKLGDTPFEEIASIREDGKKSAAVAAAKALISLAKMHLYVEGRLEDLATYSRLHRMNREGDCLSFYLWMRKHQDLSVAEFLKKLFLQKIINRHLEVAMRKMRNRDENTLKFVFEDNQLKLVNPTPPIFTTPRIPSLHLFLEDMGFVEKDSHALTADAMKVLEGGIDG